MINLLQQAIDCIPFVYYTEPRTLLIDNEIFDTEEIKSNESTIVSQIYLHLYPLINQNGVLNNHLLQTNPPKKIIYDTTTPNPRYLQSYKRVLGFQFTDYINRVPDLVLHSGPLDHLIENQILICEVKCNNNLSQNQFNIDFFKINLFHQELNFQTSCLIIFNVLFTNVEQMLNTYLCNNLFISNRNGVYVLIKESFDSELIIIELNNYLQRSF